MNRAKYAALTAQFEPQNGKKTSPNEPVTKKPRMSNNNKVNSNNNSSNNNPLPWDDDEDDAFLVEASQILDRIEIRQNGVNPGGGSGGGGGGDLNRVKVNSNKIVTEEELAELTRLIHDEDEDDDFGYGIPQPQNPPVDRDNGDRFDQTQTVFGNKPDAGAADAGAADAGAATKPATTTFHFKVFKFIIYLCLDLTVVCSSLRLIEPPLVVRICEMMSLLWIIE